MVLQREGLLGIPFSHLLLYITIAMATIKISMLLFQLPDPFSYVETTVRPLMFGKPISAAAAAEEEKKQKAE